MVNPRVVGRFGVLAVGLGIGAAIASPPGVAAADDIQVSIGGFDLFPTDGNTATANAGPFDIAIAIGNDAIARATNGFGDFSFAGGSNALAASGGAPTTFGNFDTAIDIGNNALPTGPGAADGAYAGAAALIGSVYNGSGTGSNDIAVDIGNNLGAMIDGAYDSGNDGAFAGAGGLIGSSGNGNFDIAFDLGNNSGFGLGPASVDGYLNAAAQFGSTFGENVGALAGFGDYNLAAILGVNSIADAGGLYKEGLGGLAPGGIFGYDNIAVVLGSGSEAYSGASTELPGVFDLAGVLGNNLSSTGAIGGNFLVDVATPFFGGAEAGAVAAASAVDTASSILLDALAAL